MISLSWLKDLFGLPAGWPGVFTTDATMANFVGLAAAPQWWRERHGVDVAERGLSGLPEVPVFASGYLHASDVKCLALLAIGRQNVNMLARNTTGRLDLDRLESALRGVERADSVTVDGHKWLNVPYDCGFSFVRDIDLMGKAFAYTAAYLVSVDFA